MILSTLRRFIKIPATALALSGPIDAVIDQDVINKDIKTAKSFTNYVDSETGMDRLKKMFQLDEYDDISPELHSIYNCGFMGLFTGLCYGGFIGSKKSYIEFMERNQATAFETAFQAKKKLQESIVLSSMKTGWRWGWRLGAFSLMYMGVSTVISVYRNKYSIFDYITAGIVTGALYKWKMGPRGMTAGAAVGGFLGVIAGGASIGLLMLSGTTMEEARYWQYKWKTERSHAFKEGYEKGMAGTPFFKMDPMQEYHDTKISNSQIELGELSDETPEKAKSEEEKTDNVEEEAKKKVEDVKK